jgi:hypothetical protein
MGSEATMKPLRHSPVPDGRGHRTPQTIMLLDERDALLIEAAHRFCVGMSDRQAARHLRIALLRYQAVRWQRTRSQAICPPQHRGRLDALLWCMLKVRDHVPSEMTIRRALAFS